MNDALLARLRRAILRAGVGGEEAKLYAQKLAETDWISFAQEEGQGRRGACQLCGKTGFWQDMHHLVNKWRNPRRCCEACYQSLATHCQRCGLVFLPYHKGDENLKYCIACDWKIANKPYLDAIAELGEKVVKREDKIVRTHLSRARAAKLAADFKVSDWLETLKAFDWKCAYCQEQPYENLDHFIPIAVGGGTIRNNCVPACVVCNDLKGHGHPNRVTRIPQEAIERVRSYLSQF